MSAEEFLIKAKNSFKKNLLQESKNYLNKILLLEKKNIEALNLMGIILGRENNLIGARNCFEKAFRIDPNNHLLYFNLARILSDYNFDLEALNYYSRAIEIFPGFKEAYNNKGNSLQKLGNFLEAIDCFDNANKIDPDYSDAIYNKSFCQLILGDFKNGLKSYESRWTRKETAKYPYSQISRLNNLSELKNKSLIVFSEQGLGDCIQFSRYIFKLLDCGAEKVIFEVNKKLKNLISYQFRKSKNVDVVEFGKNLVLTDFQIPLLSLPLLFGTTVKTAPVTERYFNISEKKIINFNDKIKFNNNKINVAIACSGYQKFNNHHKKRINLKYFLSLLNYCNLFLVQNTVDEEDQLCLKENPEIIFIGKEIVDFEDIGALIENMDLVISVDTVFAHLAGALEKKTFLILSEYSDWRWLLDTKNSIWYNSLILFRKKKEDNNWKKIFKEIVNLLIFTKKLNIN
jgi:tetratricopeptide (TPR) repeat protein